MFIPLILLLIIQRKTPQIIGYLGEKRVRKYLNTLDPSKYMVLHDVMIRRNDGKTSQIDHVVVSIYGVFVIETKNFSGYIFGDERGRYWTQTIYKRKEQFLNPIIQNKGHIKGLVELLDLPNNYFISIIAFHRRATLKVNVESHVTDYNGLLSIVKSYRTPFIPEWQMQAIHERIQSLNIEDFKSKKEHVEQIKGRIDERNQSISNGICPVCSGELVLRIGKHGKFQGCSNFPKCRFTHRAI